MNERLTLEQIKAYWTRQANEHEQSHAASWGDQPVIELEEREISARLSDGDHVLDIGCANGFTTVQFAATKAIKIRGLDYFPEMIAQARSRLASLQGKLAGSVEFDVGDITALSGADEEYNKVICKRVLINLGEWEHQKTGLFECARVLQPGGTLLLSEATLQGWTKMNAFRREWGLSDIRMPAFNHYLDEEQVVEAVAGKLALVEIVDFASTYYVGTRVLKPLLAKVFGLDLNLADSDMHRNKWFAQLPACGDYGTQKLFVFTKL